MKYQIIRLGPAIGSEKEIMEIFDSLEEANRWYLEKYQSAHFIVGNNYSYHIEEVNEL